MNQTSPAFHHDLRRTSRIVLSDYPAQFTARSFALSCKGTHQPLNQDSYLAADHFPAPIRSRFGYGHSRRNLDTPGESLFIVADGHGESHCGSRASRLAIEVIEESLRYIWGRFQRRKQLASKRQILKALHEAFDRADEFIVKEAEEDRHSQGMGAAVTAACTYRGDLFLAHAGDSQAFLWRAGKLHRLTRPAVQHPGGPQLKSGVHDIEKPAPADQMPPIVGGRCAGVHVMLRMLDIEPNDYLVLCTKGLMEHVADHIVCSTISATPDPQRICESLVAEAEKRTICEDSTVVVARFALAHP